MDKNQQKWDDLYTDSYHRPRYPSGDIVAFSFKNFPRGGKILDLGCGVGRHMKFLAENGFKAYGVDYTSNGVAHTKELLKTNHLYGEVFQASMEKLPFEDEFFDGLFSYGVIFYGTKEQIEQGAKEILRVLKKGAKAYLILRSIKDYRHTEGQILSKYEVVIDCKNPKSPGFGENGMRVYHFDEEEIKRIYTGFSKITIDSIRHSFENDSYADYNYVVVLTK